MSDAKYTVVQHSAFGYNEDERFKNGLEPRALRTKTEVKRVDSVGGIIFDDYASADNYAMQEMYANQDNNSIIPAASGSFSDKKIDDLAIYRPNRVNA
jgi:hypothetical protein